MCERQTQTKCLALPSSGFGRAYTLKRVLGNRVVRGQPRHIDFVFTACVTFSTLSPNVIRKRASVGAGFDSTRAGAFYKRRCGFCLVGMKAWDKTGHLCSERSKVSELGTRTTTANISMCLFIVFSAGMVLQKPPTAHCINKVLFFSVTSSSATHVRVYTTTHMWFNPPQTTSAKRFE